MAKKIIGATVGTPMNPAKGGGTGGAVTDEEKTLILALFRNAAYTSADMADTLTQLETLWSASGDSGDSGNDDTGDETTATLSSISATYSGGDVAVGTALTDLTGIVVTAHYSDGTSEAVTGYTLSGTIAEGENTITVTYGGMTSTFTVIGVAEESSLEQYEYTIAGTGNLSADGGLLSTSSYNYTDFIEIDSNYDAVTVAAYVGTATEALLQVYGFIQWFNGDTFLSRVSNTVEIAAGGVKSVRTATVPDGATKFRVSVQNNCDSFALFKGTVTVDEV